MAEGPSVGVRRTLAKGGGDGSAVGGAGRCLMSCEPILHRCLRPGRGVDLCFLWLVFFSRGLPEMRWMLMDVFPGASAVRVLLLSEGCSGMVRAGGVLLLYRRRVS